MNAAFRTSSMAMRVQPRKIFLWCAFSLFALSLLYIYLIGAIVLETVERKGALSEVQALSERVSALESEYRSLDELLDLSAARAIGYSEISNVSYVYRTQGVAMRDQ